MTTFNPARWAAVIFVMTMLVLTAIGIFAPEAAWGLLDETGLVENSSPVLWFVASAMALVAALRRPGDRLELAMLAIVIAALGFRELDLHKAMFGWSITRFINYTKDYIPLGERLIASLLILLPIGVAVAVLFIRGGRRLLFAWREGKTWPRWVLYWFVVLIAAFGADKASGWAAGEGAAREIGWFFLVALEEALEMTLALFTLLLMVRLAFGNRTGSAGTNE